MQFTLLFFDVVNSDIWVATTQESESLWWYQRRFGQNVKKPSI